MAKPVRHGDKWRIRWLDEHGKRQSLVCDDYKVAQADLRKRHVEVEEVKRGVRNATPPEKTFDELADYWVEKRAPRKRSQKDDESIIRKHLGPHLVRGRRRREDTPHHWSRAGRKERCPCAKRPMSSGSSVAMTADEHAK